MKTDIENDETYTSSVSEFSELKIEKDNYSNRITSLKIEIATLDSELLSLEQDRSRLSEIIKSTNEQIDIMDATCNKNRQ